MTLSKVTVDDFANFKLIGQLASSPDGAQVMFTQQTTSLKEDKYHTQLFLMNTQTRNVTAFTGTGHQDSSPVFSNSGKEVAFISQRELGTQVWTISTAGGEASRLTQFKHGVSSPQWSHGANSDEKLYVLVPTPKDEPVVALSSDLTISEQTKEQEKFSEEWGKSAKRYERLFYKSDGAGLGKHLYGQIVEIDVKDGSYRQITHEPYGIQSFRLAPNGDSIYWMKARENEQEWWVSNLYRYDFATQETRMLSDKLIFEKIAFSPDGSQIAALAMDDSFHEYQSATHSKLFLLDTAGTVLRELTAQFPDDLTNSNLSDLRANVEGAQLVWSTDGTYIYTLSSREGRGEVVRFAADGSRPQGEVVVGGYRDIYAFSLGTTEITYAYATQLNPSKIAIQSLSGESYANRFERKPTEPMEQSFNEEFKETEVYSPNAKWLENLQLSNPEPFWYQSEDDWWVQGWVVRPADFTEGTKYPVILSIHGGPQLNFGYGIFHEIQWLAAQGYAVVYTNPRGGKSYGQTFVNAVRHHYGQNDAADVLNGLDAALSKFDFLDGNRVAVTGGSYGGFMTNWLVGHTKRFFAAVSQRSISNWFSFFGCSDVGTLFVESQIVDRVEGNLDKLWAMSPIAYVSQVETPILLLHSEQDLRCPMEQAEQFYTWLKHLGKQAELLRIPNASHGLSRNGKPSLRIQRLEAIFEYIERHLPSA